MRVSRGSRTRGEIQKWNWRKEINTTPELKNYLFHKSRTAQPLPNSSDDDDETISYFESEQLNLKNQTIRKNYSAVKKKLDIRAFKAKDRLIKRYALRFEGEELAPTQSASFRGKKEGYYSGMISGTELSRGLKTPKSGKPGFGDISSIMANQKKFLTRTQTSF